MWPRVVALRSDTCEETLPSSSSSRAFFHLPSLATSLLLFIPITTPPNTLAASRSLTIDGREGGASTQRKQTTVYLFIHLSIHLSIRKKLYRLGLRCGSVFDSITRGDTDERKRERERGYCNYRSPARYIYIFIGFSIRLGRDKKRGIVDCWPSRLYYGRERILTIITGNKTTRVNRRDRATSSSQ